MSSEESRLQPNHKIQFSHAAGVVHPASSESKQGPIYLARVNHRPGGWPLIVGRWHGLFGNCRVMEE